MKHIVWLTATAFIVLASTTLTPGSKNANARTESAILSATPSDQERPTEKPSRVPAEEEKEVRKMLVERREAFNRHDVKTGCSYFADDADFVNVAGSCWRGRQEIEKNMTQLYAGMFKNIHFNDSETSIRFITPEVAVAHTPWEATGIVGGDGSAQRKCPPRSPDEAGHKPRV